MDELEMFDYLVFDDKPQSGRTYDLDGTTIVKVIEILGQAVAEKIGDENYNPCYNTGEKFSNSTFSLCAYDWSDNPEYEWNFKYGDIEVSWYKHIHRGCVGNEAAINVTFLEAIGILNDCLDSLGWSGNND